MSSQKNSAYSLQPKFKRKTVYAVRSLMAITMVMHTSYALGSITSEAEFPIRPITLVVPSPAGGTTDIVARILAKQLGTKLSQPVIVENRAGANGYIGTTSVLRAPNDGYTYTVMSGSLHSFTPAMMKSMPFDPVEDFALVSRLIEFPFALVTANSSPFSTIAELVSQDENKATHLTYGSYGVGSSPHLITELFKLNTGISATHIPYKGGGQSSSDLIGGQISFMFSSLPAAFNQIKNGQIKALAITSEKRNPDLPDIPTVGETLDGFEVSSWLGLAAKKGTPDYIVNKMREAVVQISREPEYIAQINNLNASVKIDEQAESFYIYLKKEIEKWDEVVKEAKIPKQDQ